jgi:hypothetical protein
MPRSTMLRFHVGRRRTVPFHKLRMMTLAAALCAATMVAPGAAAERQDDKDSKKKPSVSLKTSPTFGFAPLRVVVTAELKGGSNDLEELYCPEVEWVWGDDTRRESEQDCDPYEAGKSEIKRRYVVSHTYEIPGTFQVEFYLKQKDKRVLSGKTTVNVRPGLRDGIGF